MKYVNDRLRLIYERRARIDAIMAKRRERRTRRTRHRLLTVDMITREAVRLFKNAGQFLRNTEADIEKCYIRLPSDYARDCRNASNKERVMARKVKVPASRAAAKARPGGPPAMPMGGGKVKVPASRPAAMARRGGGK